MDGHSSITCRLSDRRPLTYEYTQDAIRRFARAGWFGMDVRQEAAATRPANGGIYVDKPQNGKRNAARQPMVGDAKGLLVH
jgi:hypothetical protein